ncbi:MAG: transcription antitermination factor NusB [Bacteroidales bacterium]|nr:transcription antitermination factor NusB [Bacteroidales bacterium]
MLSRHFLRAKVLQVLYAAKADEADVLRAQDLLDVQLRRLNELAVWQISTLFELQKAAKKVLEDGMTKFRPTPEERHPSMRLPENIFLNRLADNYDLRRQLDAYHVAWDPADDLFRRLFITFKSSEQYIEYVAQKEADYESDKTFALVMFKFLMNNDVLRDGFYERALLWEDDFDQIAQYAFMTLRALDDTLNESTEFRQMSDRRSESDVEALDFAKQLLRDSMRLYDENVELIKAHLNGWEFERVAQMDVLLLVMAISELIECPSIPERVTIDEYIELSKEFSTERSKLFVNGVLDKLIIELRAAGRIQKSGRGIFDPNFDYEEYSNEK